MTIRIFVGCAANHEDAESQAVLEYTLRKYASEPLDLTWMMLSRDPDSPFYSDKAAGWRTQQWATPFTGFRWAIPEWCEFEGRAIYMDSDVIVRADIADLFNQDFGGKVVLAKGDVAWRFCVSLWDCAAAKQHMEPVASLQKMPDGHRLMTGGFTRNKNLWGAFRGNWNCLDGEKYHSVEDLDIKAIHYSSMAHQVHLKYALPRLAAAGRNHWFDGKPQVHWRPDLQAMFDRELDDAIAAGFTVESYTSGPLYGAYNKKSVAQQGKTVPPWGGKQHAA